MAYANELPQVRVGVAAGRTVGKAVRRNRAKRLLRSAVESLFPNLIHGWDLILIARPALPQATLFEVRAALSALLKRAEVLTISYES